MRTNPKMTTGVIPMNELRCSTWWELFEPSTSPWCDYPIFFMIKQIIDDDELDIMTWLTDDMVSVLDISYLMEHSGSKHPSIVVERSYKFNGEDIETTMKLLAYQIIQKFADKWDRLYSAITTDYRPLENYDMEQTETPDITKTETRNSSVTTSVTNDITDGDVYGFNSSSPVPQTKTTRNGSTTVSGDSDDNVTTNTESGTRGLTRHGNIGVTTSQQMLQSEIDLRNNFNFTNQLFEDLDSIMCLLVY